MASVTGIGPIALAVKEALALVRDLISPENQEALNRVKRMKNLGRAVNKAEKIMLIVDDMIKVKQGTKGWDKLVKKYKNTKEDFNKYD